MRLNRLNLSMVVLLIMGWAVSASAMPNFARKYSLTCASCHAVVPRLNEFGWKFRAAGYRLPEEIGKTPPNFSLGDYIAGRMNIAATDQSSTAATPGSASINNMNIQFAGASLYVLFGALTSHVSSEAEISFNPPSPTNNGTSGLAFPVGVSTASVGYYAGHEDGWFSARVGILNISQGYGASDRGISSGSALLNSGYPTDLPAIAAGDKLVPSFVGIGGSQTGIDLGYTMNTIKDHPATLHAAVLSGYAYDVKDKPFAAIGGGSGKPTGLAPSANALDFQVFLNQILTEDGGGITALYYHGQADIGTNITSKIATSNVDSLFWTDKFNRWAIFASYPISKALLLAGYESGMDNSWTLKSFAYAADIKSSGWFAEGDYDLTDLVGVGVRYDLINPNTAQSNNKVTQITGFVNYNFGDGLQLIAQYAAKSSLIPGSDGISTLGTQKNNTFQLRISWIQ
jgi:hypothetical protein